MQIRCSCTVGRHDKHETQAPSCVVGQHARFTLKHTLTRMLVRRTAWQPQGYLLRAPLNIWASRRAP